MSEVYNPFDAIYANTERLRQLTANQMAGRQYAAGNYQGAANALAMSGDVQGAQTFANNQQEQQLRAAQVQAAQRQQQLEQLTHVSSYLATVHKQGGDVGRAIDTLGPVLGNDPRQIAQFKAMAAQDPGIFDVISGNAAKEMEPYTMKDGETRWSGGKLIASAPTAEKVTPIPAGGSAYVSGGAHGSGGSMIPQSPGAAPADPNAPPPAPAGDDAVSAYTYFVNKGYTPAQAAGIVGNLVQESSLNPNAHNPVDGGRGLGQWHGDRLAALQQFAAQNGGNWQDRNTQLAFVDAELKGPEKGALAALSAAGDDPVRAAAAFAGYERPRGWTPNGDPSQIDGWARRSGVARSLYGQNGAPVAQGGGGRIIQGNAKPTDPAPIPFGTDPERDKRFSVAPGTVGYYDGKTGEPHYAPEGSQPNDAPQLTPSALDVMSDMFLTDKKMPSVGMGKQGAAMRVLLMNTVAEKMKIRGLTVANINDNAARLRADQSSLTQLSRTADAITTSEANASQAADFVLKGIEGNGGTRFPLLNKALMAGRHQTGDAAVDVYISRLSTFATEYSKVIAGGTGSAPATDAVRREAQRQINEAASPEQLRAVIDSLKTEMRFRSDSLRGGIDTIHGRIMSTGGAPAPGQPRAAQPSQAYPQQAQMNARFGRTRGWTNQMEAPQLQAFRALRASDYEKLGAGKTERTPIPVLSADDYAKVQPGEWYLDSRGSVHQKGGR